LGLADCALRPAPAGAGALVGVYERRTASAAHEFYGAVLDPSAIDALVPDWRAATPPTCVPRGQRTRFAPDGTPKHPTAHPRSSAIRQFHRLAIELYHGWALRVEAAGWTCSRASRPPVRSSTPPARLAGVRLVTSGACARSGGAQFRRRRVHARSGWRKGRGRSTRSSSRATARADRSPPVALGSRNCGQTASGRVRGLGCSKRSGLAHAERHLRRRLVYHPLRSRVRRHRHRPRPRDPGFAPFEAFRHFTNHPDTPHAEGASRSRMARAPLPGGRCAGPAAAWKCPARGDG